MCGICGFIDSSLTRSDDELTGRATGMAGAISHRGPDGHGAWSFAPCGLAFGHRRLSIIDLSPSGHQPMTSHDGDLVAVYNGEIYNFPQLRQELEAERPELADSWRGSSDTEIMLEAMSPVGGGSGHKTPKRHVRPGGVEAFRARPLSFPDRLGEKTAVLRLAG